MIPFSKISHRFSIALVAAVLLAGCGKSPKAAAQEVCDCVGKTTTSADIGAMAGKAAECQEMTAKYQDKFSGEDLNTFNQGLTNCALGK